MLPEPAYIGVAGDWHGNTRWAVSVIGQMCSALKNLSEEFPIILQLGDFSIWPGPGGLLHREAINNVCAANNAYCYFIDGNHEDFAFLNKVRDVNLANQTEPPWMLDEHLLWLPRGHTWEWHNRRWISLGGAVSPDKAVRTEGRDWWPEEAITREQADKAMTLPTVDVMVTHDAPIAVPIMYGRPPTWWNPVDLHRSNLHRVLLQDVVNAHAPGWLLHGHHHQGSGRFEQVPMGSYTCQVGSYNCDGALAGNWRIVDVKSMEVVV
jgi:hypothetical protein